MELGCEICLVYNVCYTQKDSDLLEQAIKGRSAIELDFDSDGHNTCTQKRMQILHIHCEFEKSQVHCVCLDAYMGESNANNKK